MGFWSSVGGKLLGGIVNEVGGIVDQFVADKDLAERLKFQIRALLLEKIGGVIEAELNARKEIIVAEATGNSWLQRNWRPMLMCLFMAIILNNYIVAPYMDAIFDTSIVLDVPDHMWQLLKIGVGGYIVGRSGEKMVNLWKSS